jgi:hypothetical protein
VIIGFFSASNRVAEATDIITVLFICTAMFMLSGEMAREAYKIWKYLVAETTYMITMALLSVYFLVFVSRNVTFLNPVAYLAWLSLVTYMAYRTIHNILVSVRVSA